MADAELRLRQLTALGADRWAFQTLVFDFTMLGDELIRPWAVQGIETGLQAAVTSRAVNKEVMSLLAGGRARTIRFFSNGRDFGDRFRPGNFGSTGASGVSSCAEGFGPEGSPNYKHTDPRDRTDLRIYLNPTGGTGMSLPTSDGSYRPTYSYLIGTLWHEFHHIAASDTEQHGLDTAPPYEPVWRSAMMAIQAGFPAVAWDPVTRRTVPLWTNQWAAVPCMCASVV